MAKPDKKESGKKTGWTAMFSGAFVMLIMSYVFRDQYFYIEKYDFVILLDVVFDCLFVVYVAIALTMLFVSRISRIKHNKANNAASSKADVTGPKIAKSSTAPRKYVISHTHDGRISQK